MRLLALCALLFGTACVGDESLAKYGASGKVWALTEIDGERFLAPATMEFDNAGWIKGQAPCNRFSVQQKAPYPWFEVGPTMATKMACPELAAETAFFKALTEMTLSEVGNEVLILSNDAGRTMVFKSR